MKKTILCALAALMLSFSAGVCPVKAQQGPSTYADGDSLAQLVKMNYVYTLEDALRLSRETKKPIFFNAFADFARPCHGMNKMVFSNEAFCKWMDKNFVCLFIDVVANRYVAERYGISTWAHYLVLDERGEVVHRIVGGSELPAFQEKVAAALSPKTSLRGTTEAYNNGDRSKRLLQAYVTALNDAGQDSLFQIVLPQYFAMLTPADYPKKENWFIVKRFAGKGSQSDMFKFVVANRAKFDKSVGADAVNTLLSQVYASEIFSEMTAGRITSPGDLTDTYIAMQSAALPDTLVCYTIYDIAKANAAHDYQKLLATFPLLQDIQLRTMVEISMKFSDLNETDRAAVVAYYREREARYKEVRSSYGRAYQEIADALEHPQAGQEGIMFTTGGYEAALARAKAESKLLFVDCYTTWCGPCKMLTRQTFPDKAVGDFFNTHFVSIQIDMENGEGVELAKRWGVDAYPTMIVLDADGNERGRIVGFQSPAQLLEQVHNIVEQ